MRIDSTYVAQLDDLVFDLQVGADDDGAPLLVLGELIVVSAGADGRINAFGSHDPTEGVLRAAEAATLDEDEAAAMLERRLRLSLVAGCLVGLRFDDAVDALAA